jgi:RNA polymerase sigma-70 factor (ECF subfamily)
MDHSFRTSQLLPLLDRMRACDSSRDREQFARLSDELLRHVGGRLERLARKMLRGFPAVRRWEQTDDVLQNATLRLLRALREVRPVSLRAFLALAGVQLRRELLDLKRHYGGPEGSGRHHHSDGVNGESGAPAHEPADPAPGPDELEEWCAFHRQVERLPEQEREVMDLHFYQGMPKAEVAALLGVDVRTIQRRWNAALFRLRSVCRGEGAGG